MSPVSRRAVTVGSVLLAVMRGAHANEDKAGLFRDLLAQFADRQDETRNAINYREIDAHRFVYGNDTASGFSLPNRAKGASSRPIGPLALELVVTSEVSSRAVYESRKYSVPSWPSGRSGITLGIGYDLGQVSVSDFAEDWRSFLSEDLINRLKSACGIAGKRAQEMLPAFQDISIGWTSAHSQFSTRTLPYFVAETERAYSNCDALSAESFGALVDLTFNRGSASYMNPATNDKNDSLDRRKEIRTIKELMIARKFGLIPSEMRSMKRIWTADPKATGVVRRREAEALLFEIGLQRT